MNDPGRPIALTVACPDEASARRIAAAAIDADLAACVNLWPVVSIFRWDGRVEEAGEWMLAAKTIEGCISALSALIRRTHPYDLPAITWEWTGADPATRDWLAQSVARARTS